jgi:hypothetical protein
MGDSVHSDSASNEARESSQTSATSESLGREGLKTELEDCLGSLQSAGAFALFEHLPNPVNPGLYVEGVGAVGLPLSDRDAKAILDATPALPSQNGISRRSGTLPANCVQTRNPAWGNVVESAIQKIISGLGIDTTRGGVEAELFGLQLVHTDARAEAPSRYVLFPLKDSFLSVN